MLKVIEASIFISFIIGLVGGKLLIPVLKRAKFGQYIREEGPKAHQSKTGTPTMGGVIFLIGLPITVIIEYFLFDDICFSKNIPVILVTLGFALIGFLDDFIKVVMKRNLGLRAWQKMGLQILVTGSFAFYIIKYSGLGTKTLIPFTNGKMFDMGAPLFAFFVFFVILGTVNGSNFTDGLDGLCTCVTIPIAVTVAVISILNDYKIEAAALAMCGGLLAFFLYNVYPARVFMGDTGSLALGGFVASSAFMMRMPIILVVIAIIYVVEVMSVIIQVLYFKATGGKRFFKMAPIHHHFEMCGYKETQVVAGFMVVTVLACLITMLII